LYNLPTCWLNTEFPVELMPSTGWSGFSCTTLRPLRWRDDGRSFSPSQTLLRFPCSFDANRLKKQKHLRINIVLQTCRTKIQTTLCYRTKIQTTLCYRTKIQMMRTWRIHIFFKPWLLKNISTIERLCSFIFGNRKAT
jgi:hypothetical protein